MRYALPLLSLWCTLPIFAADPRPNIILFIADDQAWNDCGAYGHPHIRTPNQDRLAREGMRFDAAFLTCSSCSPSRSSIITGRYPHNTGAHQLHLPLPKEQITFVELLKKSGYWTAQAGKWHLGNFVKDRFDQLNEGGGPSGCENWIPALRSRPKDKPFFLWLASFDPHRPYSPNTIPRPHKPEDVIVPPYLPDVPETRHDLAMYYDEITRMDGYMGQVLDELDKEGLADNTLVLFLSDNGRPFPRCKTTIYDSGIKTPFIVRWPGHIKPGSSCPNLVSSIDIAPTFLAAANLTPGPTFQGKSLLPLLTDPATKLHDYIYSEHNWHDFEDHARAVRSLDYLYIHNDYTDIPNGPPADAVRGETFQSMRRLRDQHKLTPEQLTVFTVPRPAEELYDVRSDPQQLHNLAKETWAADKLAQMRQELSNWQKQTADTLPDKRRLDEFDRETGNPLRGKAGKKKKNSPAARE